MSKELKGKQGTEETVEKEEVAVVAKVGTQENEISEAIQSGNIGEMLANAGKAGFSLTSSFLDMEVGEVDRFVVVQKSTAMVEDNNTKEQKEIPTVLLINSNGETKQAAHTVLVNAAGNAVGKMIEVECLGKPKGKNYFDYVVTPLN